MNTSQEEGFSSSAQTTIDSEDGLNQHYDVVLCGTGLVQSILASALARAGKTVLHCDGADYYGQLDAVWTFPYLQELYHRNKTTQPSTQPSNEQDDLAVTTATTTGAPIIPSEDASFHLLPLSTTTQADEQCIHFHSMETKTDFPLQVGTKVVTPYGLGRIIEQLPQQQQHEQQSLCVELTNWTLANGRHPRLFLSPLHVQTQAAVDAASILQQNSRSLALDITPVLVLAAGTAVDALLTSGVAEYLEWKALEGLLYLNPRTQKMDRVPCNKNDVFASQTLGPMDKRRLMKFLQLAMDYGTAQQQERDGSLEQVTSLNERHLNQGRSLARPQNKIVNKTELEALEQCMNMPFETYLAEEQRLSPSLISLVQFALALDHQTGNSSSTTTLVREGMRNLCQHMASLGRFGSTAFLVPLYGSGELAQAFCRSAAVYGATYMLRRTPLAVSVQKNEQRVNGIWLSPTEEGNPPKHVSCLHVVVPVSAMESAKRDRTVVRRISILRGKLITDEQQRHVIVIPPSTLGSLSPIYGLLMDETVNVAPRVPNGCTLVHLTTTMVGGDSDESMLQKALEMILAGTKNDVEEIFHTTFSYDLYDADGSVSDLDGLHPVSRTAPGIEVDATFDQAKDIFKRICPTEDFLIISKKLEEEIKGRLGDHTDEDDDEKRVLESAMSMLAETEISSEENRM